MTTLTASRRGSAVAYPPSPVYVSPSGNDANPGTHAAPVKTLARAQTLARLLTNASLVFRGGTHYQPSTTYLASQDSNQYWMAYPGETPVISGGQLVPYTWVVSSGSIYKNTSVTFPTTRNMWTGSPGVRCARAGSGGAVSVQPSSTNGSGFLWAGNNNPYASASIPTDLECVTQNSFVMTRLPVSTSVAGSMTFPSPAWTQGEFSPPSSTIAWVENDDTLLGTAGQFYQYSIGDKPLKYVFRGTETVNATPAVIGVLTTILDLGGGVSGVTFDGLTFSHTTWRVPATDGYCGDNSAMYLTAAAVVRRAFTYAPYLTIPGAVHAGNASGLEFTGCVFAHLGTTGLRLEGNVSGVTVVGSIFSDVSANGLQIGQADQVQGSAIPDGVSVSNCYFTRTGAEYQSSAAVSLFFTKNCVVSHCQIDRVPYSGVEVGFGGADATLVPNNPSKNNLLSDCLIQYTCLALSDGGGLHSNGTQGSGLSDGFTVRGNVVNASGPGDVSSTTTGLYADEGARNFLYVNNWVLSITGACVHLNSPGGNVYVINNYFDSGGSNGQVYQTNSAGSPPAVVSPNTTGSPPAALAANAGLQSAYQSLPRRAV